MTSGDPRHTRNFRLRLLLARLVVTFERLWPAMWPALAVIGVFAAVSLFGLWLRGERLPGSAVRAFAIALLVATQLILVPSAPYRLGMFEYGLLSWFHFYVAACTAAAAIFLAWQPLSRRNFALFCALCLALAAPLATQALSGAAWLTGSFSILDQITEMVEQTPDEAAGLLRRWIRSES